MEFSKQFSKRFSMELANAIEAQYRAHSKTSTILSLIDPSPRIRLRTTLAGLGLWKDTTPSPSSCGTASGICRSEDPPSSAMTLTDRLGISFFLMYFPHLGHVTHPRLLR